MLYQILQNSERSQIVKCVVSIRLQDITASFTNTMYFVDFKLTSLITSILQISPEILNSLESFLIQCVHRGNVKSIFF